MDCQREAELRRACETLDTRYDELASDKVKLIPGDDVIRRLREKNAARLAQQYPDPGLER